MPSVRRMCCLIEQGLINTRARMSIISSTHGTSDDSIHIQTHRTNPTPNHTPSLSRGQHPPNPKGRHNELTCTLTHSVMTLQSTNPLLIPLYKRDVIGTGQTFVHFQSIQKFTLSRLNLSRNLHKLWQLSPYLEVWHTIWGGARTSCSPNIRIDTYIYVDRDTPAPTMKKSDIWSKKGLWHAR